MKHTPRMLAIILTLFLLLGGTAALSSLAVVSALTAPKQDENVECATPAQLIQQLEENEGGTVTLTGDIVWDNEDDLTRSLLQVSRSTIVKMGDFSITIPEGGSLFVDGPIRFEGSGTETPLFYVDGQLKTQNAEISAKGEGAVAVAIAPHGNWVSQWTEVSAEGENATAIRAAKEDRFSLETTRISAKGNGAVGIHTDGPVQLLLCSVSADDAAVLSEDGDIVLDATQAEPVPDDAQIIRRKAAAFNRIEENGICIAAGSSQEELLQELNTLTFTLYDADGGDLSLQTYTFLHVNWKNLPHDLSKAGDFLAEASVSLPDWTPLNFPSLEIPIHVVEPDTPFLQDAQDAGEAAFLRFFSEIDEENAVLRYSVDEGNTWKDSMELPDSFLYAGGASVEPLEVNQTYLFQLEIAQDGIRRFSNILRFHFYEDMNQNGGGDRDNSDREDQGETPPHGEIIPPPTHLPIEEEPAPPEKEPDEPTNDDENFSQAAQGTTPENSERKETEENAGQSSLQPSEALPDDNISIPKAAAPHPDTSPFAEKKPKLPLAAQGTGEPVLEIPDAAAIRLTAAELADQLKANPQGITLLGEGVKVTLPASIVKNISLSKDQFFSAELKAEEGNRFCIRFWAGNEELAGFGNETFSVDVTYGTTVNNPVDFLCENAEGNRTFASGYKNGKLIFQLSSTGEYTISPPEISASAELTATVLPVSKEDHPSSPQLPAWPFVAGGAGMTACILTSIGILRYKKKQKRR